MSGFYQELKRRNVIRMGVFYLALSWLLLQVADVLFEVLGVPAWSLKLLVALLLLGFPVTLAVAWIFEVTPEGIKREREVDRSTSVTTETGHRLNVMTIVILLAVAALIVIDRVTPPLPPPGEDSEPAAEGPATGSGAPVRGEPAVAEDSKLPVVAVLPLTSRSLEGDGSFLADGIHDDLLTQLAKLDAFRVVSRTSVLQYRDSTKTIREIGKELGATAILEGAVQQAAGRVRINAQLIDTATDTHLWSETFERGLSPENIFGIQAEIAGAIARATNATLTEGDQATLAEVPTTNQEAYEAFLRGRMLSYTVDPAQVARSLAEFEHATTLDPEFAEALAWQGYVRIFAAWVADRSTQEKRAMAEEGLAEARRARQLEAGLPEADHAEAHFDYWFTKDYERAIALIDSVIERFPSNADYRAARGWFNRRYGRWDEAVSDMQAAIERDPRNVFLYYELSQFLMYRGQLDAAERALARGAAISGKIQDYADRRAQIAVRRGETGPLDFDGTCQQALNVRMPCRAYHHFFERRFDAAIAELPEPDEILETEFWEALDIVLYALQTLGREDALRDLATAAAARLAEIDRIDPENLQNKVYLALAQAFAGAPDAGRSTWSEVDAVLRPDAVTEAEIRRYAVRFHALVGDHDRALELLSRSLEAPAGYTWAWVEMDPRLDALRDLPGYAELAERFATWADDHAPENPG